ncbi:MAG TPA: hypothetical protein VM901_08845 [Bdellovibrionota bacterium]|jgi:hypothetical protein|nr:hypothetical protein [Bdellovibrionota bacterium]
MSKVSTQGTEIKSGFENFTSSARDVTERAREVANNAADTTIGFAKKYPIHTALGALGVGCIVGFLARRK